MTTWADPNNPMIEEFLRQFAVTEQQKKAAQMNALSQAGFAMMGARKGQEGRALGNAGLLGNQAYQNNMLNARGANVDQFKMRQFAAKMQQDEEAARARQAEQGDLAGIFGGGQASPGAAAQPAGNPQVNQYRQAAAYYASRGNVEAAAKYSAIADKMEDEYSTTPQVVRGPDGKPRLAQLSKRGGTKMHDDLSPAEKLHFANAGGRAGVGFDQYSGAEVSPGAAVTLTPDQIQDNQVARGNLAVAQGNLGLSRDRFKYDQTKDAQARADAAAGVLKPKNPTEFEAKSALFADQMQSASAVIDGLRAKGFSGTGAQQFGIEAAGVGGMLGTLPRAMASKEAQVYNQAADQWSEAFLRVKTGAAATTDEVRKNRMTFFPIPGDSAEVVKRKELARREAERSVFGAAGNAATRVPQVQPLSKDEEAELAELRRRFRR